MTNALFYVAAIACLAVLAVLGLGLASFARGGADRRWSNKLMQLRVVLQLVAVILIVVFVWTLGGAR